MVLLRILLGSLCYFISSLISILLKKKNALRIAEEFTSDISWILRLTCRETDKLTQRFVKLICRYFSCERQPKVSGSVFAHN